MIKNAIKRNTLKIQRVGGDFEIRIEDLNGKVLFMEWYEMKKPHKKTYQEIEALFKRLEDFLI